MCINILEINSKINCHLTAIKYFVIMIKKLKFNKNKKQLFDFGLKEGVTVKSIP